MTESERQSLTAFAIELSRVAAAAILPHFRKHAAIDIKEGAHWDPVTEGDRAGERAMRHLIEKTYPNHGIVGEEFGTQQGTSGLQWILDPVDGTRAFVIGLPTWATLIGLYADGKPLLGVMCQPFVGDTFYGHAEGAWLDHRGQIQSLRVRPSLSLREAMIGTTAPHLYADKSGKAFANLSKSAKAVRFGLDCYSFSLLAAGHLDIAMDPALQIYDIAALIPIMQGAGGVVGSWTDNNPAQGGNVLAAASQALYDAAVEAMQT